MIIRKEDGLWHFNVPNLYLNGHLFSEYVENGAFYRLYDYLGHGLCYEAAAMIMFALRNNRSAKLIHGLMSNTRERDIRHAWVEFRYNGRDFVVSPTWFDDLIAPRELFYQENEFKFLAQPKWTCSYRDFWNAYPSKRLYQQCQRPETSYILPALRFYRPSHQNLPEFKGDIGFMQNDDLDSHKIYMWLSRCWLSEWGAGYNKSLDVGVVEDIFHGAKEPSDESLLDAYQLTAALNHRLAPHKTA